MTNPTTIAASLSEAQKRALLAFPEDPRRYSTPKELGVAPCTLWSLNGFGGVDPKTLQLGPILVTYDVCDNPLKRLWAITKEGLAVRHLLKEGESEGSDG